MYAKMIEEARAKGLTSDKIMVASIADVDELLHKVREMDETLYWRFIKKQHEHMFGCHYNENFGEWRIKQMHYKDKAGTEHHAPHWTKDQYKIAYESVKAKLPPTYNCWDFAVALESQYADTICLYKAWWPEATDSQLEAKVIEATVNYLNDDDNLDCKVWNMYEK